MPQNLGCPAPKQYATHATMSLDTNSLVDLDCSCLVRRLFDNKRLSAGGFKFDLESPSDGVDLRRR
jgi:hypothetical protein